MRERDFDEYFKIWTESLNIVEEFNIFLNNLHSSLQFTQEMTSTKWPFLDTLVVKKDIAVTTDTYYKHTDTHQYSNFKACHSPHKNARRIWIKDKQLIELREFLLTRAMYRKWHTAGYKVSMLQLRTNQRRIKQGQVILSIVIHNPYH